MATAGLELMIWWSGLLHCSAGPHPLNHTLLFSFNFTPYFKKWNKHVMLSSHWAVLCHDDEVIIIVLIKRSDIRPILIFYFFIFLFFVNSSYVRCTWPAENIGSSQFSDKQMYILFFMCEENRSIMIISEWEYQIHVHQNVKKITNKDNCRITHSLRHAHLMRELLQ